MATAERKCVIVSASPDCDPSFIERSVCCGDFIVCADGGLDTLAKTSLKPDLIVGDFDSAANENIFPDVETITLKVRKIDTDTMHCVDVCLERGFSEFLLLGATGGRTDHALANLSILLYLQKKGAHGVISDKYNDIMLLHPGENKISAISGTTVSVLPFGESSACLSYTGMSYPLDHGTVTVDYPYTISNIAVEDEVTVTLHSGSALLFVVHGNE